MSRPLHQIPLSSPPPRGGECPERGPSAGRVEGREGVRRFPARSRFWFGVLAFLALAATCSCASAADLAASRYTAFLKVRTIYSTGQLKVWVSDDGQAWRPVASSAPFAAQEAAGGAHGDYLFALEYLPAYLRFGAEGAYLGRLSLDSAQAFVGTEPRAPLEVKPLGAVLNPENLKATDGQPAIIFHRGQEGQVDGFQFRFQPTPKPPGRAAKRLYWGNYVGPRDASEALVKALAWWDFTIFQEGAKLEECVRQVKALNPKHRVVLRLWIPGQSPLLYAYDADAKAAIRMQVLGQFSEFANLVDTVSLSEEEPGNTMRGWMFGDLPPEGIYLYKDQFERETGQKFVWKSPALTNWLGEKFHDELNDLYTVIHKRYPKIKVYQWVELRDYGNISGYPQLVRGEDLKMDGYVLEWGGVPGDTLIDTPLGPAAVRQSFFERYLATLMARNHLRPDQILGQVWPFTGDEKEFWEEVEGIRATGVPYIYNFWPNAGMPELPEATWGGVDATTPKVLQIWKDLKPYIEADRK